MLDAITVSTAVANALGGTLEYTPEFTVGETQTKRIVVVPATVTHSIVARSGTSTEVHVQVALVKKTAESGVPALIRELLTVGESMLNTTVGGGKCTEVNFTALYDGAELREKHLYVGVCELTFLG